MENRGNVFPITGGASGLGAGTARMLAQAGGKVVLADLNEAAGMALASELAVCSCAATYRARPMRSGPRRARARCAASSTAQASRLPRKPSAARLLDVFAKTVNVNVICPFDMIRVAAAAMAATLPNDGGERGVIVSTVSVAAYDGQIGPAAYAASKAGVAGMTLPIARDASRSGIRVMTIAPGLFETPMLLGTPGRAGDAWRDGAVPPAARQTDEYAMLVRQIVRTDARRKSDPARRRDPEAAAAKASHCKRKTPVMRAF
ncbi:SDR family NAD(P)-dependent oxidoreductase [Burkholderia sp. A2]|uniref:SDR family NAD(P)-dependent oxidoreductase n=1 Tax=Burkholderia sp. A2 TaxID=236253 RepID=UPI000AE7F581|nr:SDR family NAD(P)-dependent oxidoreductase [Burkholderia sp. A2]